MPVPVVTVDGPSGTGKGTIAGRVAALLGWHLLDSGALYRAVALTALARNIPLHDSARLADLARTLDLQFRPANGDTEAVLDGRNVTDFLRSEDCGAAASVVAALPAVRAGLLDRQRGFRQEPGLVADGRDMGTVVFPDARLKIFLTASAEERVRRRHNQLKEKGLNVNLARLSDEIAERDRRDRERPVSPLIPAHDAIVIDTTQVSIDAVMAEVSRQLAVRGLKAN
jgi:cytidylate kinase